MSANGTNGTHPETARLLAWMSDRWKAAKGPRASAINWNVTSGQKGLTRGECVAWWLGEHRRKSKRSLPPPAVYTRKEIANAWLWFLRARPEWTINTFLRPERLPDYMDAVAAGLSGTVNGHNGPAQARGSAERAFSDVVRLAGRLGFHSLPERFSDDEEEDAKIRLGVRAAGGWAGLCNLTEYDKARALRAFSEAYAEGEA